MTNNTPTADQAMEYKIQEAGLNAPRLTPAHIDSVIRAINYIVLPCGRTTICQLTLMNGYTITGESASVSKENFNEAIGKEIAYNNARDKIWMLEDTYLNRNYMKRNLYMAKTFNNYIGTKLITAIPAEKHTCTTEACPENIPGYKVIYEDGYTSWSPKNTFEKAYMPTNGISLGLAIDAMKLGLSVRLPYWSEDVFLSLQKPTDLSKMTAPYIYVTSRFGLVPWVATQVELLSTEWEIIND